ncbi:MAG: rhomboid family intramembrane serine protease [Deltaproteobacteria bacterium]|nr:rhomboid family intramembrane serine protease [Deltaproteobacteria bacterium]
MRQLRIFDDKAAAQTLGDTLFVQGIENTVNETRDGAFAIWVHEEEELDSAKEIADEFEQNPKAPRFLDAPKIAGKRRKAESNKAQESRHKTVKARKVLDAEQNRRPPVTVGLALVCVLAFALMNSGGGAKFTSLLSIQGYGSRIALGSWGATGLFQSVLSGEVWRLVTPIFLHFGILHLVFNLSWLWMFGSILERSSGSVRFGWMVLVLGVSSNIVQYVATGSPLFGGMSGVIYGLFGYLWMRGRYDTRVRYQLPGSTVLILLGWYLLCVTGIIGAVANGAHTGGLVLGAAWGYLASGDLRRRLLG